MPDVQTNLVNERRQVLRAGLGWGAAAMGGLLGGVAHATSAPTRIDVHAHLIPDFYLAAMKAHGVQGDGGIPIPSWSPSQAVKFMDKFGIQAQVVSLSEPGLGFLPTQALRSQMAMQVNDYIKDALLNASSGSTAYRRFGGFACLPLAQPTDPVDVAQACQEATRALTRMGLDGVGLYTHYDGVYLGDPQLDPLMRTLNDLHAVVFIHPVAPPARPDVAIPNFVLEFPFETTRAVTHMLYKGIFLRYPHIRWVLPHAGGTIPFLSYRAGLLALNLDPKRSSFSGLYFDTALSSAPPAMAAVRQVTDVSHILLGTDYPYAQLTYALKLPGDPNSELGLSFNPTERQMVDRGNALSLLPGLGRRLA